MPHKIEWEVMNNCYQQDIKEKLTAIEEVLEELIKPYLLFGIFQLVFIWILTFLMIEYQEQSFIAIFAIYRTVEYLGSVTEFSQFRRTIKEMVNFKRLSRNSILFQLFTALFKVLTTVYSLLI